MATVATSTPTPSSALEWLKVIITAFVVGYVLFLITYAVILKPDLLFSHFDMLWGIFIALATGAGILLGLMTIQKK